MTKPRKYTYRIQYIDNTFQIVDWTKSEFKQVGDAMNIEGRYAVTLEDGIFRIHDIRAIVLIPDPPEPTEEEKKEQEHELSEWGFVDAQTKEWLVANGIDFSKGVND